MSKREYKTIPYGLEKRGNKLHPHNECAVCSENSISKTRARRKAKEDIAKQLEELEDDSSQS